MASLKELFAPSRISDQKVKVGVSEEVRTRYQKMENGLRQRKEELENSTHPCTVCGEVAHYVREGGFMQGAYHVFSCPSGHESAWKGNQGKTLKS